MFFLTDQSLFQLYRNTIRVSSSRRGRVPVKLTPKFGPKVMVWCALSFRGFYLKVIDGPETIDIRQFCTIVEEFLTYADCLYPDGWILEQDEATPHTSKYTKNFLHTKIFNFYIGLRTHRI